MPIVVNLDVMMARRKISLGELAALVGISPANLSVLKNNRAKAIRFTTLSALCRALRCQPGDLLEYRGDPPQPDAHPHGLRRGNALRGNVLRGNALRGGAIRDGSRRDGA